MKKKKNEDETFELDEAIEEANEKKVEVKEEKKDKKEEPVEKKSHKFLNFMIILVILITGVIFYAKYVGTKGLIVKEYRVESNILTSNFSGLKIVHFSDLLYKSTVTKEDVNALVEKINILKPDIVVFTGDLVNKNIKITTEDTNFLIEKLSSIYAKIGKYAVYGDYDYSYKDYEKVMSDSNFKILNNSYEEIYYNTSDVMYLVGLSVSSKESVKLEDAFKFYSDDKRSYTIVLAHDGKTIKSIDDSTYEVDLILLGHSLNGSVVIPYYGGLFKDSNSYKYSKPYYSKGITNIYVSSGLGTNKYGYRLFNTPSFNLYRLKAQP